MTIDQEPLEMMPDDPAAEVPHVSTIAAEAFAELAADDTAVGQRHQVVRTGEREPIPRLVRWLVWHRDRGRCQGCGRDDVQLELDHVTPWSASGSDDSTNLRLLCRRCNTDRSNYRSFELGGLLPVAEICDRCMETHGDGCHMRYTHPGAEHHTAFCGTCKRRSTVTDTRRLR